MARQDHDEVVQEQRERIIEASRKHPLIPLPGGAKYKYGTAGFRMASKLLDGISFRVGLLAALRSKKFQGQAIGVMITASHNPAADNGVKIVDFTGEMLVQDWERYATDLVNAETDEQLVNKYIKIAADQDTKLNEPAIVIYGRDTRPSGHSLAGALRNALMAAGCQNDKQAIDAKIVTTPQLHYLVRAYNRQGSRMNYGEPTEAGYYKKLSDAFQRAMRGRKISGSLTVDCANGVGGPKLKDFLKHVPKDKLNFDVKVVNDDVLRPEILNHDCGADYVKTKQRAPLSPKPEPGARCCSLDGDADRLIYYYTDPEKGFFMLDGDRISSLVASYFGELLESSGLRDKLQIGVVQTAYANGASTKYLKENLRLPVACTATGVKHLHHRAAAYDIGIYFEANGHGTVLFSDDAIQTLRHAEPQSPAQQHAIEMLLAFNELINQTVGDAISDMLMVEAILAQKNWTLADWLVTYTDLPNRQLKVEVADKDLFETTDAERRLVRPEGAQGMIDAEVAKFKEGRAFARASGTENVCRVYAEAATRHEADELAERVAHHLRAA